MSDGESTGTAPQGGYLRSGNLRRNVWKRALVDAGFDEVLRIHDLRATAASLMIVGRGVDKAVRRALGHASAKVTLDTLSDKALGHCRPVGDSGPEV